MDLEQFVLAHEPAIRLGFFVGVFAIVALWDGGMAAVLASEDPLIRYVLQMDAAARAAARPYPSRGARRNARAGARGSNPRRTPQTTGLRTVPCRRGHP